MRHYGSVHVEAASPVRFHCDQERGASWLVGEGMDALNVYLGGTAEELRDFADRCRAAADEYDQRLAATVEAVPS